MSNKILNNADQYGHALVELIHSEVISVEEARKLLGLDGEKLYNQGHLQ